MKTKKIKWTLIAFLAAIFVSTFIGGTALTANTTKVYASGTNVAYIETQGYETIGQAISAAQVGETVKISAGNYTGDLSVNKAITLEGERDAEGNNLVTINGRISIKSDNSTLKNVTVVNPASSSTYDCAVSINAKNVTIDGCDISGYNGTRYCYTRGLVTFKNSKISAENFTIHFDGYDGGEIRIDNCDITGWMSYGSSIKNITITNSNFKKGNWSGVRLYQENVTIDNCTFENGMKVDLAVPATVSITNSTVEGGADLTTIFNENDLESSVVVVDNIPVNRAATVERNGEVIGYYTSIDEAIKAAADKDTVVVYEDTSADKYVLTPFNKSITIKGAISNSAFYVVVSEEIKFNDSIDLDITFENVHFWYGPNSAEVEDSLIKNKGLSGIEKLTYNNCSFSYQVNLYDDNVTFNNCVFIQDTEVNAAHNTVWYNVCIHEAKYVEFNDCSFTTRGGTIHIHNDGSVASEVWVKDCNFLSHSSVPGVAVVEIVSEKMYKGNIVHIKFDDANEDTEFVDPSLIGYSKGEVTKDEPYAKLWDIDKLYGNNKITVCINGKKYLEPAVAMIGDVRYTKLEDAIKDAQDPNKYEGQTITLVDNCEVSSNVEITKPVTIVNDTNAPAYTITNKGTFTVNAAFTLTGIEKIVNDGNINIKDGGLVVDSVSNNGTVTLTGNVTVNANFTGTGWVYVKGANFDANTKMIGAKVRFASGENNIDGATITGGYFQVGIGAYKGTDANVDTVNGVTVNVYNNATIGATGDTYAGWVGTGFYDTDAEKAAVMKGAKYELYITNSIAEFGYLHVSNDGTLVVIGNATTKAWYNNSDYTFYAGDFIINGLASFTGSDALAFYTKVSCDNGTDNPGCLAILDGATYEAERHNGATAGLSFDVRKTGVVNVEGATLEIGDDAQVAKDAKIIVINSTFVVKGSLTNNGKISVRGDMVAQIANLKVGTIKVEDQTNFKNSTIAGEGTVSFTANGITNFYGTNSITAAVDDSVENFDLVVNEGATLLISRYTLGYGRDITVYGNITDAKSFDPNGVTPSLKFNGGGASVNGYGTSVLIVENAYVDLDSSSLKNGATGKYTWNFTNSYVKATSFNKTNATNGGTFDVTFTNSVLNASTYIKNGVGVTYNFVNSTATAGSSMRIDGILNIDKDSIITANYFNNNAGKLDEHSDISGEVNVNGKLILPISSTASVDVFGTLRVYATGIIEAGNLVEYGNGKIIVNVDDYDGTETQVIDIKATTLEGIVDIENTNDNCVALVYGDDGDVTLANGVAKIGDIYYPTLAKAISVVKNNDTIVLLDVIDEDVFIRQLADISFTIDGNGQKYTGTIEISGNNRFSGAETLTIKNINFVADTNEQIFILANDNSKDGIYPHNITVKNCNFTNAGNFNTVQGMKIRQPNKFVIDGCTASDMYTLVQNTSGGEGFVVRNSKVTNCDISIRVNACRETLIENVEIIGSKEMGIRMDSAKETYITIKDTVIGCVGNGVPLYINKASGKTEFIADYKIILENNKITAETDNWIDDDFNIVNDSIYTLKVVVGAGNTFNGADLGTYIEQTVTKAPITFEAKIKNVYYSKIETAFAEAIKGDTIDILCDVTLTETIEIADADVLKDLTINGNGHTVTLNTPGAAGFRFGAVGTARSEKVTINDLTITGNAKYGIWVSDGGSTTLNNVTIDGTYEYDYGGLILYGTQGATITDSSIVSMFTNGGDDLPLNIKNSKIDVLFANASQSAADKAKVFIDDASIIGELWIGGNNSTPVDTASLERVGLDKAFSESTGKNFDAKIEVESGYFVYYATVNDAIYVVEDGGIVYVLPGTIDYEIAPWANDTTHASEKSITLRGAGWNTNYTEWFDNGVEATYIQKGIFLGYDDNHCNDNTITIEGFSFSGKGVLVSGQKNVVVNNNMFMMITDPVRTNGTANANAISVTGQTYGGVVGATATITNNYIYYAAVAGINLRDAYEVEISGNRIVYVGHNGITVTQTTAYDAPVTITNNVINTWANYNTQDGRAVRVLAYGDVTINENAFIANNLVESIVKVTNTDSIDVSRNYWAGGVPMTDQYFEYDTATKSRNNIIFNYYAKCDYDIVDDTYTLSDLRYLPAATIEAGAFASVSGTKGTESYRENIQLELKDVYTYEKLYVEIWSDNTLLGVTTLKDVDDEGTQLIPQLGGSLTVNSVITGRKSGSWNTVWNEKLSVYNMPNLYKVYVDGWLVDTWGDDQGENPFNDEKEEGDYILLDSVEGKEVVRITETGAVTLYFADATKGITTNHIIEKAIYDANDNDTVAIYTENNHETAGYVLPNFNTKKSITIKGEGHYVYFNITQSVDMAESDVTFELVSFEYKPNTNYKGLTNVSSVTYKKCEFLHQVSLYGEKVVFEDCIFNQDVANSYSLVTYNAENVIISNSSFTTNGSAIYVYNDGNGQKGTNLELSKVTFINRNPNPNAGMSAIEINTEKIWNEAGVTVKMDKETIVMVGYDKGDYSGEKLWNNTLGCEGVNNDITVTVDGTVVLEPIHNVQGRYDTLNGQLTYTNIQSAIDDNSTAILLLADINGKYIPNTVEVNKDVAIDLNGKTVTADFTVFDVTAKLAISNGTVNATNGAAVQVTSGKATITNGTYTSNTNAIVANGGELVIIDGTIGAIYNNGATTVITGGTIDSIYANDGTVTIKEVVKYKESKDEPKVKGNVEASSGTIAISAGFYIEDVTEFVIGGYRQESPASVAGYTYEVNYRPFEAFHMTLGSNISIYYHVYLTAKEAVEDGSTYMTFDINNGKYVTKYQYDFKKEDKPGVNHYLFELDHINPALMGDTIIATLYIGSQAVSTNEYSIREYCDDAIANIDNSGYTGDKKEAYMTLLADLLDYGAAAQLYTGYRTNNLANEGFAVTGSTYVAPNRDEAEAVTPEKGFGITPKSVQVVYGDANTIRFNFIVENATGDKAKDLAGKYAMVNRKGIITILGKAEDLCVWDEDNQRYYMETQDILATELDFVFAAGIFSEFSVDALNDGAWITYSIESAVTRRGNNGTKEGTLLAELWCYGESSKAFAKAQNN